VARVVGATPPDVLRDAVGSTPLGIEVVVAGVVEPVVRGVDVVLAPEDDGGVEPGAAVPLGAVVVVATSPGATVKGAEKTFGAVKLF
jgi:hypothetical protein